MYKGHIINKKFYSIVNIEDIKNFRYNRRSWKWIADYYKVSTMLVYKYSIKNGIEKYQNISKIAVLCAYCGAEFKGVVEKRRPNKKHFCCKDHYSKWQEENAIPENSNFYIDGRNARTDKHLYRKTSKYREWRKQVYERDNYTCRICDHKGGKLEAHHIKPQRLYPELRYDINNGVTLCMRCHKTRVNWKEHEWVNKFTNNETEIYSNI